MADNPTTVKLGMLPVNRGSYTTDTWPQNIVIYKDNIVQFNGSSYIYLPANFNLDNPAASATSRKPYDSVPSSLNTGWAVFASGNNQFTTGESVDAIGIDAEPTDNSHNLIESGGVKRELDKIDINLGNYTIQSGHYIYNSSTGKVTYGTSLTDTFVKIPLENYSGTIKIITAVGGVSVRQWVITDDEYNVISISDASSSSEKTFTNDDFQDATYLIVQSTTNTRINIKLGQILINESVQKNVEKLQSVTSTLSLPNLSTVEYNGSAYYGTDIGSTLGVASGPDKYSILINVEENLPVFINRATGGNSVRQWVFADINNKIIAVSAASKSTQELLFTPFGATRLYVQDVTGHKPEIICGEAYTYNFIFKDKFKLDQALPTTEYQSQIDTYDLEVKSLPQTLKDDFDSVIIIENQESFNAINTLIEEEINNNKSNIGIILQCDKLFFNENHIDLSEFSSNDVDISIIGQKTIIESAQTTIYSGTSGYNNGLDYRKQYISLDEEENIFNDIKYSDARVVHLSQYNQSHNPEDRYFKIKLQKEDENTDAKKIHITAGWCAFYCDIDKIEDGWAYFYCTTDRNAYIANAFYMVAYDLNPRYRLYDTSDRNIYTKNNSIYLSRTLQNINECNSTTFIKIGSSFKNIDISGCIFKYNSSKSTSDFIDSDMEDSLIYISDDHTDGYINIHNNVFESLKSKIITCESDVDSLIVNSNKVQNCYRGLIHTLHSTDNVFVLENYCENCGRLMHNDNVIDVKGENFLIKGNDICDFNYCAIRTGTDSPLSNGSEGIIEFNNMWYNEKYAIDSWKHTLVDSGAIYTYSKHQCVIIRDNYINNYQTHGNNYYRGIYLDGHSSNVKVYRNIIIGCDGNYTISLAKSSDTEKSNNNFIGQNVLTGAYILNGYNSIKALNYMFSVQPKRDECIVDFEDVEDDYEFENCYFTGGKIIVPLKYKQLVSQIPIKEQYKLIIRSVI